MDFDIQNLRVFTLKGLNLLLGAGFSLEYYIPPTNVNYPTYCLLGREGGRLTLGPTGFLWYSVILWHYTLYINIQYFSYVYNIVVLVLYI